MATTYEDVLTAAQVALAAVSGMKSAFLYDHEAGAEFPYSTIMERRGSVIPAAVGKRIGTYTFKIELHVSRGILSEAGKAMRPFINNVEDALLPNITTAGGLVCPVTEIRHEALYFAMAGGKEIHTGLLFEVDVTVDRTA